MSLPTHFELSILSMLAKLIHCPAYPASIQNEIAIDEALSMWDSAGHHLGQIAASQDPKPTPEPPYKYVGRVPVCPFCRITMDVTTDGSWLCKPCGELWVNMPAAAGEHQGSLPK